MTRHSMDTSDRGRGSHLERGSVALEMAMLAPVLISLLVLVVAMGRVASARSHVDGAAFSAARAASISRDSGAGTEAARVAARDYLDQRGLHCTPADVNIDAGALAGAAGTAGAVRTTVSCTVALGDLGLPFVPGSKTFTADAASPVDTWRAR